MTQFIYGIHPSGGIAKERIPAPQEITAPYGAYKQGEYRKALGGQPIFKGKYVQEFMDGYNGTPRPDLEQALLSY